MGFFDRKKKYYWVAATSEGRSVLLSPPQTTESAARAYANKMLGGNFYTIEEMDTADQTKATRAYRAKILGQTHNIPFAISRMTHKIKENKENKDVDSISEVEIEELHNDEY